MAKVLVVEDDVDWADIYGRWATRAGHGVVNATSAEEARELIAENGIDLVLTDGLEDQWIYVHDAAQASGIRTLVVSGSLSVEREAERRDVEFVGKSDTELRKRVGEVFASLDKKNDGEGE